VSLGNVFDVLELMVESHLDLPSLGSVAIFVDAVEVWLNNQLQHIKDMPSAFLVHCKSIKLILGSKEAEETNLLEFIRKVGLEGGEVGGGGRRTWWWPMGEAQQPGNDGDTRKPGKPLDIAA